MTNKSTSVFACAVIVALCGCGGTEDGDDDDVVDLCGNNVQDPGESCDDGNRMSGDGCDEQCVIEATPTAYRIQQMNLADPHAFAAGLLDVTDTVDQLMADSIAMDGSDPPDGLLDFSVVPVFRPLDQGDGAATPLDIVFADCPAPQAGTSCARSPEKQVVSTMARNGAGACMSPDPGTTGGYDPPVTTPGAPCFVSDARTFDVQLGSITLTLEDARIAASYAGDPATSLTSGLIMGFVTEAQASATILPEDLLVVGGKPLTELLKAEDKDTGPNGDPGWWFYLNFTAQPVPYTD